MKKITLSILLGLLPLAAVEASASKIAFERGDSIWIADRDGTHSKKIAAGSLPDISPDGSRVAFNTDADSKTRPGPERHIAIVDSNGGKVTVLKDIPSDNCFGPVWSPDGSKLVFSIMADKDWHLGVVTADGSGFQLIRIANVKSGPYEPAWARDGKSIFCHDLDNIYQIDIAGSVLKRWELAKILADASMNSNDRLSLSSDGKTLLMDVDCGAEHERKNWDGPQPAIYKFDLDGEKAVRVTGKNDFVWEPFWLNNGEFLCIMQKEKENEPSIYQMSSDGKTSKLLIRHARRPSASAP